MRVKLSTESVNLLQKTIRIARRKGQLALVQRCSALLFLDQGNTQQSVATAIARDVRTVRRWLATFLSEGIKALKPKKAKGRPPYLTKTQKQKLKDDLQKSPESWGYSTGCWCSALVQDHIKRTFGVSYCIDYICQLLRNLGLSYTKPKFHYAQAPKDFTRQLDWIRLRFPELYANAKACNGVILFQDECRFQIQTNTAKTWHLRGQSSLIERNPKRKSVKIFAAIELFSGELSYSFCEGRMNQHSYSAFLKRLHNKYSPRPVFVVCDNATYHGGFAVRAFLHTSIGFELVRLPKRSPHLNPIEKLFKELKRHRTHNRYFESVQELESAVRGGLVWFQRNKDRVTSLMTKWLAAGQDPQAAYAGDFDSSFIPQKQIDAYELALKENSGALANA